MSEDFHDENNSSKLSNCANPFENSNEINTAENSDYSDEEEINVIENVFTNHLQNGNTSEELNSSASFNCNCQTSAKSEVKLFSNWLRLTSNLLLTECDRSLEQEREISLLRKENEMLKEKISRLEKVIPLQINEKQNTEDIIFKPTTEDINYEVILEDMTQGPLKEEIQEEVQVVVQQNSPNDHSYTEISDYKTENGLSLLTCESQIPTVTLSDVKDEENSVHSETELNSEELLIENIDDSWKHESDFNLGENIEVSGYHFSVNNISEFDPMKNLKMSIRRKRVTSNSSGLSHNESLNLEEKRTYKRRYKKKKRRVTKDTNALTSLEPYVTQSHEVNLGIPMIEVDVTECTEAALEVPRWRHKLYASCYTMEGTENLDDEVFNKRHMRLENDERRRKRWDVQRIREQRVIEKLKQRQERAGLASKEEDNELVTSLWPKLEDIKFLEVSEELPVAAFGHPITKFDPCEFHVPWMDNPSILSKKSHSRKSKLKRRCTKR
ncbi:uncharacterized protein msl-1 [Diabrotica undecimpunctata]|uniref:uncharacterized protein msl-1 n=1 Tax=Diabrotica undecimpunctata TaxID=50387 RepID=UPI003B6422D3